MGRKPDGHGRITTCCYCGARSTLPPSTRREALVCHGCGAPIRVIEAMAPLHDRKCRKTGEKSPRPAIPHGAERRGQHLEKDRPYRRRKGKRRPGFLKRLEEAFDDLDDILDIFD